MSGPSGRVPPGRQGASQDENPGWAIFSYLIGGMAVYAGIGWLIGQWLGHTPEFLAGGMIVGLALALVLVIRRYGRY